MFPMAASYHVVQNITFIKISKELSKEGGGGHSLSPLESECPDKKMSLKRYENIINQKHHRPAYLVCTIHVVHT